MVTLDAVGLHPVMEEIALLDCLEEGDGLLYPGESQGPWDPRDDWRGENVDLGWIGETEAGIWCRRHPEAAFLERPELWDALTRWQTGPHEFTSADVAAMSNWQLEAHAALSGAYHRELKRRAHRGDEETA